MDEKIALLDCTLRDGAYIVDAKFGNAAIAGIIKKMQSANINIIECGWLKNSEYREGSSFFHIPNDLKPYMTKKEEKTLYTVMIDWDRYNLDYLPENDHSTIDAIRVVFPHGKYKEGISIGKRIQDKGYKILFQAANTLAYSDEDLRLLAEAVNAAKPEALSIVDTFGAMYEKDLTRIASLLDRYLAPDIRLGFHSHNNQQLSFALSIHFVEMFQNKARKVIVDASLCGMGRGAGNTTTELLASYLNREQKGQYDMDMVMDAIDTYMTYFLENYSWGYSTPYFIAGLYGCHVNNIAYLLKNHRTNAHDMRNIIASLSPEECRKYDYDLLEQKYLENQNRKVDDSVSILKLQEAFKNRKILLIAPGKSTVTERKAIQKYIETCRPIVIAVNALNPLYQFDYFFIINTIRYQYAKEVYPDQFKASPKILLSSIKKVGAQDEIVINFDRVVKRGWIYFDNAVIDFFRLLDLLQVKEVAVAGFDGFQNKYNESYADAALPTLNPDNNWDALNREIADMYAQFKSTAQYLKKINFVTPSIFEGTEALASEVKN